MPHLGPVNARAVLPAPDCVVLAGTAAVRRSAAAADATNSPDTGLAPRRAARAAPALLSGHGFRFDQGRPCGWLRSAPDVATDRQLPGPGRGCGNVLMIAALPICRDLTVTACTGPGYPNLLHNLHFMR